MTTKTQQQIDDRIDVIHKQATALWPKIEAMLDELKRLGPHSRNHNNANLNIRERLKQLSTR